MILETKRARHRGHLKKIVIVMVLSTILLPLRSLLAQYNHPYPRTSIFNWGGAPIEWYAKFDLIDTPSNNESFVNGIKAINPDAIVLPTRDWNYAAGISPVPDEWYVRDSQGNKFPIYGGGWNLVDFSNFCPRSSYYGNKRYNEYLPEWVVQYSNLSVMDGVACDGIWEYPYQPESERDVDLDRNGVNDWDEHGRDWITARWLEGVEAILARIRELIGERPFLVNSGRFHSWGWESTTGVLLEKSWALYDWDWWKRTNDEWLGKAPQPHAQLVEGWAGYRHSNRPEKSKNDFETMRFLLTSTMLGDGYYTFCDIEAGEHAYNKYYDEFDLNVGYPTTNGQEMSNGVWVRFFDKGVSLVNPTGSDQYVSDGDLAAMSGYAGPYYRFYGGQDPDHNNGELFTGITLFGAMDESQIDDKTIGDGIILLNEPLYVVSDIHLDDHDAGTSPSNDPPEFNGNWEHSYERYAMAYTLAAKEHMGLYAYSVASAGSGEATATYRINVGVTGRYTVYEWHGHHGTSPSDYQEGTNVPLEIRHAQGTMNLTIDQSQNYGDWNLIGTFEFARDADQYIQISNDANGYVLADAFKLVFEGAGPPDETPPNEPRDFRSDAQTDSSITLTWSPPMEAEDGDIASAYQIYREGTLIRTQGSTTYLVPNLNENTSYFFEVYAVDDRGNVSLQPASGNFSTLADMVAPVLKAARPLGKALVEVVFSEPVTEMSAENAGNYTISGGISVLSASLQENLKTVHLVTSAHDVGTSYTITVNNVYDRASNPNVISAGNSATYQGISDPVYVSVAVDNECEVFINGTFVGNNTRWEEAANFVASSRSDKNVIAIKGIDAAEKAGLVAVVDFDGKRYVSDDNWKITTTEESGWQSVDFNDTNWQKATSYGLHGEAEPWSNFRNVSGIPTDEGVHWIWTADNENDNVVYVRFTLRTSGDTDAPNPPQNVKVNDP